MYVLREGGREGAVQREGGGNSQRKWLEANQTSTHICTHTHTPFSLLTQALWWGGLLLRCTALTCSGPQRSFTSQAQSLGSAAKRWHPHRRPVGDAPRQSAPICPGVPRLWGAFKSRPAQLSSVKSVIIIVITFYMLFSR